MAGKPIPKHQRNKSVYTNLSPSCRRKRSRTVKVIGFYFQRNITVNCREWRPSKEFTVTSIVNEFHDIYEICNIVKVRRAGHWPVYQNLTGQYAKNPPASIPKPYQAVLQNPISPYTKTPLDNVARPQWPVYQNPTGQYTKPNWTICRKSAGQYTKSLLHSIPEPNFPYTKALLDSVPKPH